MNYISHYYTDNDPADPYFNFGLMLPDMLGTVHRGWKPITGKQYHFNSKEGSQIWQGFQRHLLADSIFHNTDFFSSQTRYIRNVLEQAGLVQPGLRLFFVAHVLLEIMLDRLIIKTHPDIPDRFYNDLAAVDEQAIAGFFSGLLSQVPERLFHSLARFKEHKYLYSYAENEQLFFALNRIMERAGQTSYSDNALPAFSFAVAEIEATFLPIFDEFFKKMRQELQSSQR
jgi:hypothetical protein